MHHRVEILQRRASACTPRAGFPARTLLALLCGLALLALAPSAGARSPYPAGAQRPLFTVTPARLAAVARAQARSGSHTRASAAKSRSRRKRKPPAPTLHGDAERALLGFEAMQRRYYVLGSGLYAGEPFSYLWPFSQAFAATVSMANVSGTGKIPGLASKLAQEVHLRLVGLANYLDTDNSEASEGTFTSTLAAFDGEVAPPVGPGGPKYYDDNDWMGIELVRTYELTHKAAALGDAEAIMAFEMAGYSEDPQLVCPGGIPFSNISESTERNTVTNAPAAELSMQLYKVTGNGQYLQFAEKAYGWVHTCLEEPNHLYADHIGDHGVVEKTYWSYNQGSMIGAGVLLYRATGNGNYINEARQTATAAISYFNAKRLEEENPFFPSVYFRNLLYLDALTHESTATRLAQEYVNHAWEHLRLPDGTYVFGTPASAQLLTQAAFVQVYALLSSPPSTYF